MRSRGIAKRSARRRTSATSPASTTTNFHQAPRRRNSRIASGLIRLASGTPEPASFTETFHWATATAGEGCRLLHHLVQRHLAPSPGIPGVFGVTPRAAHGAALEPDEDGGHPRGGALSLDRKENFGDAAGQGFSKVSSLEHAGVSSIRTRRRLTPGGSAWRIASHASRVRISAVGVWLKRQTFSGASIWTPMMAATGGASRARSVA